jgi:hypothetical protein
MGRSKGVEVDWGYILKKASLAEDTSTRLSQVWTIQRSSGSLPDNVASNETTETVARYRELGDCAALLLELFDLGHDLCTLYKHETTCTP